MRSAEFKEDAGYEGVRVRLQATLAKARIPMQIDIGFGDVIVPQPAEVEYPTLLDFPAPMLIAYPKETVVAEKLEALTALGLLNSRIKDYYDLALLSRLYSFDGRVLVNAIRSTFRHRGTPVEAVPVGLTQAYSSDPARAIQWRAFVRRSRLKSESSLDELVAQVRDFSSAPARRQLGLSSSLDNGNPAARGRSHYNRSYMPHRLRHAICNEIFENWTLAKACRAVRQAGYGGIEIAPFTLAEYPSTLSPARRRECRDTIASEGLRFVGLHWLMVSPKGLHVTTPDVDLRCRSWQHIDHLIDLCADLGPDGILVFGSPKQRATTGGLSRADATRNFVEGLAAAATHAGQCGVTILIEALPLGQCDVVTSLDEAAALVRQIDHPAIRTMFDCHNAIDETEPHAALVERHYDVIRHIHVNELDGRHPGTGSYDFKALFDELRRREYGGWISLEAFDFTPGAATIARESLAFLGKQ